ncbi:hypothetical protein GCM10008940_16260 [Microbulbifer agarilyticus]
MACGRLTVTPLSGQPVPRDWLSRHFEQLASEIARQLGRELYLYDSYSTGRFDKGRLKGVQLQFTCALTGESRFVIFNAEIERRRDTKYGRSGAILPGSQFKAGKKSAFADFWQRADLPQPQRKGWYSNLMGKLNGMIFTGAALIGEKLDKQSLKPLNLAHGELAALFQLTQLNSPEAHPEQCPNNSQTVSPNTRLPETQAQQRVHLDVTTGAPNHGNTVIRQCGHEGNSKSPYEQTDEEWLADYNRHNPTAAKVDARPPQSKEVIF